MTNPRSQFIPTGSSVDEPIQYRLAGTQALRPSALDAN
jgi:hypothetical protein